MTGIMTRDRGAAREPSTESSTSRHKIDFARWHFDIDGILNRFLPPPPWHLIPRPISHFLGYRGDKPQKALGNLVIAFWSLIGVFSGVLLVAEVSTRVPEFEHHHAPIIVGSFGAAAVLEFCAIESPFAQPRNALISQLLASVIGVGIAKLFSLDPVAHAHPAIAGSLACAITTMAMVLTNTVHPPAGATALLAATDLYEVSWWLVPIMLLGCSLMLSAALMINNIQRRFPVYWWTPAHLGKKEPEKQAHDVENAPRVKQGSDTASSDYEYSEYMHVVVRPGKVEWSDNLWLDADEKEVLERISERMKHG